MDTHSYRVSGRQVRRVVDAHGQALESLPAVLRGLDQRIDALTREQADVMQLVTFTATKQMERMVAVESDLLALRLKLGAQSMTFWQRLRWLVRGV